jgi:hypothetical protein
MEESVHLRAGEPNRCGLPVNPAAGFGQPHDRDIVAGPGRGQLTPPFGWPAVQRAGAPTPSWCARIAALVVRFDSAGEG